MVKDTATREIKLETIFRAVKDCDNYSIPAGYEALIAACGRFWGTRRQSAQELLKQLVGNEMIVILGQDVWTYERFEKIKEARTKDFLKMTDKIEGGFQKSLDNS